MNHPVNLFFLIILAFITVPLTAQESNEDHDQSQSPYFLVKSDNPETDQLPLLETTAEVKIAGVIADITVHQVYKNEGKNALEA
ncbi:MAG: trypsin, partial [Bacteroidota bacterium]